jgi:hypothetical protein
MQTIKSVLLTGFAAVAVASAASGQEFQTDINPALRYYQAFITAPKLSAADYDYLFTNRWYGQVLPERFGQLISQYDTQFRLVRQAAQATVPCDWGIDSSDGPGTLLPHLAEGKAVAVTSQLRALWDLQNGKETEACKDLLATFALAHNISRDGTLIGVLCETADEAIVLSCVGANFGQFSPRTLQQLIDGFDATPAGLTLSNAFFNEEQSYFIGWTERKILQWQQEYPGDDAKVLAKVRQIGLPDDGRTNAWDQAVAAANGTSSGVLKLFQATEPFYQQAIALSVLPYSAYQQPAAQFQAQVDAAKTANPVVAIAFPNLLKARAREFKMQTWMAMIHAAVAYKQQGQAGLLSVNDPCGQGPFQFQRFVFQGVDRGFKLTSAYTGSGFPEAIIFVETPGTPFRCDGPYIGRGY